MSQYLENPGLSQSGHCFICNTETVNINLNSEKINLCERFCILVGRYLNFSIKNNSKSSNFKFDFKKTLSSNSIGNELEIFCCCESCFAEVEVFCVFFEQFSLIQLELNAKLGKIAHLIKSNELLPRKANFVEKFRNAIASRVQKGYKNFPRLQLTNLKDDFTTENESEPIQIQIPQEKANEVTDCLIIKEEVTAWRPSPKPNLPFKCRNCGKGFALGRSHPHKCNFFGRKFAHKVTHDKIHTGGALTSQFMCFVCKTSFLHINDCKIHITKMHKGVGKILQIKIKPKSQCESQLPLPSSTLTPINPADTPNVHENSEDDDEPLMNPKLETGAELPLPSLNVNAGDNVDKPKIIEKDDDDGKPFKCLICGKGFYQKVYLDRHQVIHNEARPYKCPYCGKSFKVLPTLVSHKRTHLGIKPFQCGLCGFKFARSTNCRVHQKNVHGVTDGVIIRKDVDIPNNTENAASGSAPVSDGLLFQSNDHPATAPEGRDQYGNHLNDLHSITEYIGNCVLPAMAMTDEMKVEQPEHHIFYPKIEMLEGENLDLDLCDPLADV